MTMLVPYICTSLNLFSLEEWGGGQSCFSEDHNYYILSGDFIKTQLYLIINNLYFLIDLKELYCIYITPILVFSLSLNIYTVYLMQCLVVNFNVSISKKDPFNSLGLQLGQPLGSL